MTNTYRLTQKLTKYGDIQWALDKYADYGVMQVYETRKSSEELTKHAKELQREHKLKGIVIKQRASSAKNYSETIVGDIPKKSIEVVENDIKFIISLRGKLDVGLFLDHRPAREFIGSISEGKSVLNLFSYTSSFSLYAALNGAKSTTSVDLSKTYTDWSNENFELNGLEVNNSKESTATNFIWKRDAKDFLEVAKKIGNQFDIVILDPPSFSKNKKDFFNVQEDHEAMIQLIYNHILTDKGVLLFSNNYKQFELSSSLKGISEEITHKTIPEEFKPYKIHRSFLFQK